MVKVIDSPIDAKELTSLAKEIGGFFIKVVVDTEKEVMAAGARMHVDEERALAERGSNKEKIWGGGYDLETKEVTFDSIINNKPGVNASSDILDPEIRAKFEIILKRLLGV